jgi:hypothetical protein
MIGVLRTLLVLMMVGGVANADVIGDAVARVEAGEAKELVEELGGKVNELDDAQRCALGLAYAGLKKPDRVRALVYLPSCGGMEEVTAKMVAGTTASRVDLVASARVSVEVPGYGIALAPSTVYLPAGQYELKAKLEDGTLLVQQLSVAKGIPAHVLFELPKVKDKPPADGKVDFGDEEPGVAYAGAPKREKPPSILSDRYQKAIANARASAQEQDAVRYDPPRSRSHSRLLLRVGIGGSNVGGVVMMAAAGARTQLRDGLALDGHLDAIRVGEDAMSPGAWIYGLGADVRYWPLRFVSVAGGVRGDVRRVEGETDLGATVGGGVALHLFGDQIAVELRGEQGLTRLADERPRALLLELSLL